jgi:hypothetical protein
MAADIDRERQHYALQTIFSFFLGLMVLAFIGIGVNTFYPQPDFSYRESPEIRELQREQQRLWDKGPEGRLSEADQKRVDEIQDELDELYEQEESYRQGWARNTSIVLIIFATLVMGISLIRSEQLRVISNGLLLGGLFTMVYGVGWIIASGESVARFGVIVFALAVTVALGYLKFVRGREAAPAAVAAADGGTGFGGTIGVADQDALAILARRVEALEARTRAAAAALRQSEDEESGPREE